jgi:hypothetical protein
MSNERTAADLPELEVDPDAARAGAALGAVHAHLDDVAAGGEGVQGHAELVVAAGGGTVARGGQAGDELAVDQNLQACDAADLAGRALAGQAVEGDVEHEPGRARRARRGRGRIGVAG